MEELNLMDAIQLAKAAEQQAADVYSQAARETLNALARRLFEQLADFEMLHYRRLVELEDAQRAKGAFIEYEGRAPLPVLTKAEVGQLGDIRRTSAVTVIKRAIDFELEAEGRYKKLAKQTMDPQGCRMFERLANEERNHSIVLQSAYFDLSNLKPLA